jgi:serine/threonine-protein kinase
MQESDLSPIKEGEVLAGRYRVDRVIGVGGMGVVVAATHVVLGQRVAIKFLLPHALIHKVLVARFSREARAAVRIRSEHVARVLDVGELDSGAPYIVMEYLEGNDLHAMTQARGKLPVEEAVDYVLQACVAVAEAHSLGIVHRDLKPSNLFLVGAHGIGTVKVLDFGISKMSVQGEGDMTQSESVLGSPAYMSPEQMTSSRDVDSRTDIWALGVILYELIAGKQPFSGDSIPELCIAITQRTPPRLSDVCGAATPALNGVVMRCLDKDRTKRFASVLELAEALTGFGSHRSRLSIERIQARGSQSTAQPSAQHLVSAPAAERTATAYLEEGRGLASGVSDSGATGDDRQGGAPASAMGASQSGASDGSTHANWGNTARRQVSSTLRRTVIGALGAGAILAAGAWALLSGPSEETGAAVPSAGLSPPAATVAPPPQSVVPAASAPVDTPKSELTRPPAPSPAGDVAQAAPRAMDPRLPPPVRAAPRPTARTPRIAPARPKRAVPSVESPAAPSTARARPSTPKVEWEDER